MFLKKIAIKNFRTLEDVQLDFKTHYTAICGKNDSGKSNIINAIKKLLKVFYYPYFFDKEDFTIKDDFPKWKEVNENSTMDFCYDFKIEKISDSELFDFINKYTNLNISDEDFDLKIEVSINQINVENIKMTINNVNQIDDAASLEILKKIRNSNIIKLHNSIDFNDRFFMRGYSVRKLKNFSEDKNKELQDLNDKILKITKKVATSQQKEISDIIGRLKENYTVSLNFPQFDIQDFPYEVALTSGKSNISLKDWGSGTQNRTQILINLIEAKKIKDFDLNDSKITPLLIIEEPESFLHPSAQAEFGKLLQTLSEELQIQVIVTTHNPFMLNIQNPLSNILLNRKEEKNKIPILKL